MQITPSTRQIINIALPIMIGSAAQNIIQLSDSVFLSQLSEADFAAIGFVGVFYLAINAIGYGFSKGGQILIANMAGQQNKEGIRRNLQALGVFEAILAIVLWAFMHFASPWFFSIFIQNKEIYDASLEFIKYRSFGIFFSYAAVTLIALYTGIARTRFIMYETIFLLILNGVLNYALIFGKFGLPAMGIGGSALASTISEGIAVGIFFIYMWFDKSTRELKIFSKPDFQWTLVLKQLKLAGPIVAQNFVGLGSWFLFFSIIEDMGVHAMAISNLVRVVYLILSIPTWGFASTTNTIVSNLVGQRQSNAILPTMRKTAIICFIMTMILAIPFVIFPEYILYPIIGTDDASLLVTSKPTLLILLVIVGLFSIISIYVNGIAGLGATIYGLWVQIFSAVVYISAIYIVVDHLNGTLNMAWSTEILYWLVQLTGVIWFFTRTNWQYKLVSGQVT